MIGKIHGSLSGGHEAHIKMSLWLTDAYLVADSMRGRPTSHPLLCAEPATKKAATKTDASQSASYSGTPKREGTPWSLPTTQNIWEAQQVHPRHDGRRDQVRGGDCYPRQRSHYSGQGNFHSLDLDLQIGSSETNPHRRWKRILQQNVGRSDEVPWHPALQDHTVPSELQCSCRILQKSDRQVHVDLRGFHHAGFGRPATLPQSKHNSSWL